MPNVWNVVKKFKQNRSGAAAVYVGIASMVLVLIAGAATEVGRSVSVRTQLQRAVDSAALAGASAYTSNSTSTAATTAATNYMNGAIANLRSDASVSFNVTLSTVTSSSTVTDYVVNVTAAATVNTRMSSSIASIVNVSVAATADNPVYSVKILLSGFSSSAADGDAIYYYIVPSDLGTPTSMTQIFNNFSSGCIRNLRNNNESSYYNSSASSTASSYVTVTLTAGQKIGFALVNITGCNSEYSPNSYGSAYMHANTLYSHMYPPSIIAYPKWKTNCALQVTTSSSVSSGSCYTSTPAMGAFSCATAGTTPYYFSWNDMGGGTDDHDYNDAMYKIGCSSAGSSYSGVVLTN